MGLTPARWWWSAYTYYQFRPLQRPCSLVGHRFSGAISSRHSRVLRRSRFLAAAGRSAGVSPERSLPFVPPHRGSARSVRLCRSPAAKADLLARHRRAWLLPVVARSGAPLESNAAKPFPCCCRPKRRRLAGAVDIAFHQHGANAPTNLLPVAFKPGRRLRPLRLSVTPSLRHFPFPRAQKRHPTHPLPTIPTKFVNPCANTPNAPTPSRTYHVCAHRNGTRSHL
jgi:hypothetical protein